MLSKRNHKVCKGMAEAPYTRSGSDNERMLGVVKIRSSVTVSVLWIFLKTCNAHDCIQTPRLSFQHPLRIVITSNPHAAIEKISRRPLCDST